jgi:sulfur carrier protein
MVMFLSVFLGQNHSMQAAVNSLERVTGIEPAYAAWEAAVLPLNYTRLDEGPVYWLEKQLSLTIGTGIAKQLLRNARILLQFTDLTKLIALNINGNERHFDESSLNVAQLVRKLGLEGKRLAIERNGEIVPRGFFADTALVSGDRLEIVGAVGGG